MARWKVNVAMCLRFAFEKKEARGWLAVRVLS